MDDRSRPYISFLVRLWHTGTADAWRASATDPHTGEQRMFADLAGLFDFLAATTQAMSTTRPGPRPPIENGTPDRSPDEL